MMLLIGSLPTIVLEAIVSSICFIIDGVWSSPINAFIEEVFTFRFETSLLGLDIILNKIWIMQFDTWGRLKLTGIMIIPNTLLLSVLIYSDMKAEEAGMPKHSIEDNWGLMSSMIFSVFLIIPGWFGGFFWLLIKVF
jgi:hypothetical protein